MLYWDEIDTEYVELEPLEAKDIISLLQQGEAYKQMWEELEGEYEIPQEPEDVKYTRRSILSKIKRIANKYYWKYVKIEAKEAKQDEADNK